jgi:hypothetical protein
MTEQGWMNTFREVFMSMDEKLIAQALRTICASERAEGMRAAARIAAGYEIEDADADTTARGVARLILEELELNL